MNSARHNSWHAADEAHMQRALQLARTAEALGEVPVGCVVVRDGVIVGEAYNNPIGARDPTAHAEIAALRMAGHTVGNYRLLDCDLYVTLEPCSMCAGAMIHARLRSVFYGARDEKTGAAGSAFDVLTADVQNHHVKTIGGVLAEECGELLASFFKRRREEKKALKQQPPPKPLW
jgi:tRNA(adenine34) deaminase